MLFYGVNIFLTYRITSIKVNIIFIWHWTLIAQRIRTCYNIISRALEDFINMIQFLTRHIFEYLFTLYLQRALQNLRWYVYKIVWK